MTKKKHVLAKDEDFIWVEPKKVEPMTFIVEDEPETLDFELPEDQPEDQPEGGDTE